MLNKLQGEVERLDGSLKDAENRKLIVQKQIADAEIMQKQMAETLWGGSLVEFETDGLGSGDSKEISQLKKELSVLQSRYTEYHPDVVRVKGMLEKMEAEKSEEETLQEEPTEADLTPQKEISPMLMPLGGDFLRPQLDQINGEIQRLKSEILKVQSKMEIYQTRVEETPKREQELLSLNRDYKNLKDLYDSMLGRKLEAELAVSMERKQKGEQFRVIDTAKVPQIPVEPDTRKILLLTIVLGLGLGGGLAYVMEMLDTSYQAPEDLEKDFKLPVLVSMPIRYTEKELRRIKIKTILSYSSVAVGFVACATAIIFATKGVDPAILFFKKMLGLE
jgi:hypothetical protein